MKKRTGDSWMPADEFGRSIPKGLSINILVRDMEVAIDFQKSVLGANIVYSDPDFAVVESVGAQYLLHADHTYLDHPMTGVVEGVEARGAGAEFRLYGVDPDKAEALARETDNIVLDGAIDKPHGLREVFLVDPDGYVWVPSVPI